MLDVVKFTRAGATEVRPVRVTAEYFAEWPSPNRWGVSVRATDSDNAILGSDDVVSTSYSGARKIVEKILDRGFQWCDGVGWASEG